MRKPNFSRLLWLTVAWSVLGMEWSAAPSNHRGDENRRGSGNHAVLADAPDSPTVVHATMMALTDRERDAFLQAHNQARAEVGVTPVFWSEEIAQFALDWIQENQKLYTECVTKKELPELKHRPQEGKFQQRYGENLACWGGSGEVETVAKRAVALWLEEKADFDKLNKENNYQVGDENGKKDENDHPVVVGHYTQIVWKNTARIGAAKWQVSCTDADGKIRVYVVIVCNYDPYGNIVGAKPF